MERQDDVSSKFSANDCDDGCQSLFGDGTIILILEMALFEKYLQIKKSNLPGAGKGLFTQIDIPKGKRVVEYKGRLRLWKDVKHLDGYNGYLMYISNRSVIDAQPARKTLGRYANDAKGIGRVQGIKNNCEYVSEGPRCYIESLRRLRAGEEILVGYGYEFWKLQKKISALKT